MSRIAIFLAATLLSAVSHAEMYINKSIVELGAGPDRRDDVVVFNKSSDTLYVSLDSVQVVDAGLETEHREPITDPEAAGLLVTPNKLIIPPGGRKTVRMVALSADEKEKIYRVNVTPIAPPIESSDQGAQIQVVVAYQVLVISRPQAPTQDYSYERDGDQLVFTNKGNTNVMLTEGSQCTAEGECAKLPSHRLYAGDRWTVTLPFDESPVNYTVTGFDGIALQVF